MIRNVAIYTVAGRPEFYAPDEDAIPTTLIRVACKWEARPYLDDEYLVIPRLGKSGRFTARQLIAAARLGYFRLRIHRGRTTQQKAVAR